MPAEDEFLNMPHDAKQNHSLVATADKFSSLVS